MNCVWEVQGEDPWEIPWEAPMVITLVITPVPFSFIHAAI